MMLLVQIVLLGFDSFVRIKELNSMILMGPFHPEIVYDSVICTFTNMKIV